MAPPSSGGREAGVGTEQEQERRFEGRTRWFEDGPATEPGVHDPWNRLELRKGVAGEGEKPGQGRVLEDADRTDVEMKWKDLEKILIGPRAKTPPEHSEALQGPGLESGTLEGCVPGSACASRLEQMEREHREKVRELEERQERERRESDRRMDQTFREEAQRTVESM